MKLPPRTIALALAVLVVASWTGVGAFYMLAQPTTAQWAVAVTAAAVVTEVAFWLGAGLLGLRALKNRRQIFAALFGLSRADRAS